MHFTLVSAKWGRFGIMSVDDPTPPVVNQPEAPNPLPLNMAAARPVYMPETFTGVGREWSDWAEQFELAADVNRWDDEMKLKFMSLLLSGRARDIYSGLSTDDRNNYTSLKAAMGRCLEPCDSNDWNRASFLSRRRLHNESAREFGNALRRLIIRAYPAADNDTRDLFARDHFIEHVGNGDLRINLRSAKPSTLENAINLAAELELIRSLEHNQVPDTRVRGVVEIPGQDKQMELLLGVVEGLRQEVKSLQSTVQSLQSATASSARTQRQDASTSEHRPNRWTLDRRERGEVCWNCGCDRHIKKNCPYMKSN